MSLVLDALRRVEKPEARPGSVGVALASYRPRGARPSLILPLALGIGTGAALRFVLEATGRTPGRASNPTPSSREAQTVPASTVPAAMPPTPLVSREPPSAGTRDSGPAAAAPAAPALARSRPSPSLAPADGPQITAEVRPGRAASKAANPPLVLQAISERDSRPIAVISEHLVREGDVLEGVRILSIGAESVDVLLENGRKDTLRFAPPPPAVLSPTPASR